MTIDPIISKIEASRTELLDLGLRNPLLNYRALKSKGVEAVDEMPSAVFDILVHKGREMSFRSRPDDDEDYGPSQPNRDEGGDNVAGRHTDRYLQTNEPSDRLQTRLLRTYYTANTAIEEQGVNTLFVALGMVEWYESESSDNLRKAPLVLVPVELSRTSARGRFNIGYTGEELGANLSFIEKARVDFGIRIPGLPDGEEDLDLDEYFSSVERSVEDTERWLVDRRSVVLGFFSFSKFLMYKDLDPDNDEWPDGSGPLKSKIVRALYQDGFTESASAIGDEDHLDEHLRPEDVHHVVDADSSQAVAIHDANNGRNLVIQGPPGTGKSQTITNIIAEAVGAGKKVLFVSEKMAALEVVKRRLDELHLGGACLELHSHKTAKKVVLDELKRAWDLGKPNVEGMKDDFAALARVRSGLNEYAEAVNSPVGSAGVSPFEAYGELLRIRPSVGGNALPRPEIDGIDLWSRSEFDEKRNVVSNLQDSLKTAGAPRGHIFWGCQLEVALPSDVSAIRGSIDAALGSLDAALDATRALGNALRMDAPEDAGGTEKLVNIAEHVASAPEIHGIDLKASEWRDQRDSIELIRKSGVRLSRLHNEFDSVLTPDAWAADVSDIRRTLVTTGRRRLRILSATYRRAKKHLAMLCRGELPGDLEHQIELAEAMLEARRLRETLDRQASVACAALGRLWQEEETGWDEASPAIAWTLNLFEDIDNGKVDPNVVRVLADGPDDSGLTELANRMRAALDSLMSCSEGVQDSLQMDREKRFGHPNGLTGLPFEEQQQVLKDWASRMDEIHDIARVNNALAAAESEGLHSIAELAGEWKVAPYLLTTCFEHTRYERILDRAFAERPALVRFDGDNHESQIRRFGEMDNLVLDHNRRRVSYAHWDTLPASDGPGRLRVLRREMEKKRKHLPIRRLIAEVGDVIQDIKPVFMMSPMSIATYIEPGSVSFNLVLFDEASQVRPVDALGALMRAEQAVVVGDDRQLPPTSFFDAVTHTDEGDDSEESVTENMESILGLMRTAGCPNKMLRWHYRSRHESLIALSNREFYENRLVVFPSPDSGKRHVGLQYHHIPDSVYDRGRSRTNRKEAGEVAKAVMEHAREHPELTLGVAAFSVAQMEAILDQLELLRHMYPDFEPFFGAHPEEPFFVKNLENVQGDERDVIFISVGYGRDANGQVTMNFGPLSRDGGERRLNVIITRARRRCHVFTNLRADDINLGDSSSAGVRAFKTFLAYAETGVLPSDMPIPSERDVDSPFQREVASRLRSLGYEVHEEVASGGKFVDIGIVDSDRPGRYLLGIECDGAAYHSSRSARDRDRIREQHLKSLGWQLHRIWSTDWFRNPERELSRAAKTIEQAKVAQPAERTVESRAKLEIERSHDPQPAGEHDVAGYELARPNVSLHGYELHELPANYLLDPITEVVRVESPVHVSEVKRRIADAVGVKRIGARIEPNLDQAIREAVRGKGIVRKGKFLWDSQGTRDAPAVRDRSAFAHKNIKTVSPDEIAEAIKMVVQRSYGVARAETIVETARLLGFKKTSKEIRTSISRAITKLVKNCDMAVDGDQFTIR